MADDDWSKSPVPKQIICAICLNTSDTKTPKALPCGHEFCLDCLITSKQKNKFVICPECSYVLGSKIEVTSLPDGANDPEGSARQTPVLPCDSCKHLGEEAIAVSHCTACAMKYCIKHLKYHETILPQHKVMNISEYDLLKSQRKITSAVCPDHDQPYTHSCEICKAVLCMTCIGTSLSCEGHKHKEYGYHDLRLIDELAGCIRQKRASKLNLLTERHAKLFDMMKDGKAKLCDLETRHGNKITELNQKCENEVRAVKQKFKEMEDECMLQYKGLEQPLTSFLDTEVAAAVNELGQQLNQLITTLRQCSNIDLVKTDFTSEDKQLQLLLEKALPSITLSGGMSLYPSGTTHDSLTGNRYLEWAELGRVYNNKCQNIRHTADGRNIVTCPYYNMNVKRVLRLINSNANLHANLPKCLEGYELIEFDCAEQKSVGLYRKDYNNNRYELVIYNASQPTNGCFIDATKMDCHTLFIEGEKIYVGRKCLSTSLLCYQAYDFNSTAQELVETGLYGEPKKAHLIPTKQLLITLSAKLQVVCTNLKDKSTCWSLCTVQNYYKRPRAIATDKERYVFVLVGSPQIVHSLMMLSLDTGDVLGQVDMNLFQAEVCDMSLGPNNQLAVATSTKLRFYQLKY